MSKPPGMSNYGVTYFYHNHAPFRLHILHIRKKVTPLAGGEPGPGLLTGAIDIPELLLEDLQPPTPRNMRVCWRLSDWAYVCQLPVRVIVTSYEILWRMVSSTSKRHSDVRLCDLWCSVPPYVIQISVTSNDTHDGNRDVRLICMS